MKVLTLPEGRLLEVVALRRAGAPPPPWPAAPGAVHRDGQGLPAVLHHAPARWLVSPADAEVRSWVEAVTAHGCVVADVSGKWRGFRLVDAARVLASTLDVEAALGARECAALTLFDCPVIAARGDADYLVWVPCSFSAALLEALSAASP
jgi:hypothetical protein